jgi:hypothetical protein
MIRDIALAHGDDPALLAGLRVDQIRALDAIAACGTPAMGLHQEVCDACGDQRLVPNTCGHRCCPHCQGRLRAAWVAARQDELLPCGYFHVVMTLPSDLRALSSAFPAVVLGILMQAASEVLATLCRDPRRLGAEIGQLAVLHTWKRDLGWHPHVHVIVTAGGWDAVHGRWIPATRHGTARTPFLLPVAVLRSAFQRRMRTLLLQAYRKGLLPHAQAPHVDACASLETFTAHLDQSVSRPWVLRIEPPFGGPVQVLKYLGMYVGRVAIAPKRIVGFDREHGTVTYTWTANKEPDRPQQATIPAVEFLQRFAQHILPPRFQRIRFRGLWATAHRAKKLLVAQRHLRDNPPPGAPPVQAPPTPASPPDPHPSTACPHCGRGHYQRVPDPCPRPPPRIRRTLLATLRQEMRRTTPTEVTPAA